MGSAGSRPDPSRGTVGLAMLTRRKLPGPRQNPIKIVAQLSRFIPPGNLARAGRASFRRFFTIGNFGWEPLHHLFHQEINLMNQLLVNAGRI